MRRFLMTAAALTLGTSALAWAPALATAQGDNAKFQSATYETAKSELSAMGAVARAAKIASWESAGELAAKHEEAFKPRLAWLDLDKPAADTEVETASWKAKDGLDIAGKSEVAMGGPFEPVASAEGYPPCDPGPGDDRCIQLYEPGVRDEVAQWKSGAEAGMGGPYEPAAAGSKPAADPEAVDHSAMGHGDEAAAAAAAGKPVATDGPVEGKPAATTGTTTAPAAAKPSGIGGPFEAATDYPPCRPGPGDDRCIQLYERGVTARRK